MSVNFVGGGDVNIMSQWVIATPLCLLGNDVPLRLPKILERSAESDI